jgi:hypothetical protein
VAWYRFFLVSTMLVLSLSSLVMYTRSDFLSVSCKQFVIAIVAYYFMMEGRRKSIEFKYLSLAAILSLVIDIIWFVLFTPVRPIQIWYEDSLQPENLHSVEGFALWLSILNFILKMAFAAITWRHGMELDR